MAKPLHQWQTQRAIAVRSGRPSHPDFTHDTRAEHFVLRHVDGREAHVSFGLDVQHADALAASDPGLVYAAMAWLCARGQRQIRLKLVEDGRVIADLCDTPFGPDELGVTAQGALRVITLTPSNTEMVDALGCFARVIACDVSSDYPAGVQHLERLGHDLAPDVQRIAELAPELVISSLSVPGMERVVTELHARGIPQIVLAARSLADVLHDARRLAQALGVVERGHELVARLEAERAALHAACPPVRTPVYLEWWPKPMFTPGRDCYSNELIALAGGRNVFDDRPGSSVEIDAAQLVAAAPAVCFVSWCGVSVDKLDPENLRKRAGLDTLSAVRAGRVHVLDEAFSGRPGPRMLEAARIMARAIHGG